MNNSPLEELRIADPETHAWVQQRLSLMEPEPDADLVRQLAHEIVWALSLEHGMGAAVAEGLLRLMARAGGRHIPDYIGRVRQAAATGPTLARLLARHLVPVLLAGEAMLEHFTATLAILRSKGTYTLSETLQLLSDLLDAGEFGSAESYLHLLSVTFGQTLSYNLSVRLVYLLPGAVRGFAARRRQHQIAALARVVQADPALADPFLEGMQLGSAVLGKDHLDLFVARAIGLWRDDRNAGSAFIALSSEEGRKTCAQLQVAVALSAVQGSLGRYLNARLGRPATVAPLSDALPAADTPLICSDGRSIYLAGELDHYPERARNQALAKLLVRLEAGFLEYGTFYFDLERAGDLYPEIAQRVGGAPGVDEGRACDAQRFFACFEYPELAEDLFDLFEQARVLRRTAQDYPGLAQQAVTFLAEELRTLQEAGRWDHPLAPLYSCMVLDHSPGPKGQALATQMRRLFERLVLPGIPVEACARMVCQSYARVCAAMDGRLTRYRRLAAPFGRRLRWDLAGALLQRQAAAAARVRTRLAEQGVKVYRADLQHRLNEQEGRLSSGDIQTLVLTAAAGSGSPPGVLLENLSRIDLSALLDQAGMAPPDEADHDPAAFYYPEWDHRLHDYLREHVRVQESLVEPAGGSDFYRAALERYRGFISRMRRAFELLKPEGLILLRRWPEGDDFDYRALVDFALDVRAGRVPSDRLYIKRLKQQRDVAVLLLMDLSRSTANPVVGGQGTVLTVAKEALVLFCEALQVVGDRFAIAGFSGTGRHAVDYFRIKDFDEVLGATVHRRICALQPQRSTRMGAAIRHSARQLQAVGAQVKLLILVSDGFPNDLGYKADYAIADTRKAVQEARSLGLHVKAIAVQIGSNPRVDELYGRFHHHVIADVRELADKLLRLYGTLTRRL